MSAAAAQPGRLLLVGLVAIAAGVALGALARQSGIGAGSGKSTVASSLPDTLDAEAMRAALAETLLEPDTLRRAVALEALLERLDAGNALGAERAIDPIVVGVADCDVEAYVQARTRFDPRGAFQHALRWPSVHKRGLGVLAATFGWALHGGALEARAAVESLRAVEIRKSGLFGLLQGWASSDDVEGATRYLTQMPNDEKGTRDKVLLTFVTSPLLAYGGPDRLLAWFEEVPDDAPNDFKRAAFRNALLQLASEDPERAVAFYEANAGRDWRGRSLWLIAVGWQKRDPEAALGWLLARDPEEGRREAMVRAMQRWHSRDRAAAARWVAEAKLDDDPKLRRALRGIVLRGQRRGSRS